MEQGFRCAQTYLLVRIADGSAEQSLRSPVAGLVVGGGFEASVCLSPDLQRLRGSLLAPMMDERQAKCQLP